MEVEAGSLGRQYHGTWNASSDMCSRKGFWARWCLALMQASADFAATDRQGVAWISSVSRMRTMEGDT